MVSFLCRKGNIFDVKQKNKKLEIQDIIFTIKIFKEDIYYKKLNQYNETST